MKLCISMMELQLSVAFMALHEILWHMNRMMNLHKSNYRAPRVELSSPLTNKGLHESTMDLHQSIV